MAGTFRVVEFEGFVLGLSLFAFVFGLAALVALAYAPGPLGIGILAFLGVLSVTAVARRVRRR